MSSRTQLQATRRLLAAAQPSFLRQPLVLFSTRLAIAHRSASTSARAEDAAGPTTDDPSTGSTPIGQAQTAQKIVRKPSLISKVGRATATSSYFVVVVAGVGLVGVVLWALVSNLFFETQYLHNAIDLVKASDECRRLIGGPRDMKFYGQRAGGGGYGRRGGPVQSIRTEDGRVVMVFHVEGPLGYGTAHLEEVEKPDGSTEMRTLYVDVPGHARIWLKRETQLQKKKKLFSW
ncbi:mitochondrial import inner membrane translocase subunit tim21 [Savitreella phatthalungensis]